MKQNRHLQRAENGLFGNSRYAHVMVQGDRDLEDYMKNRSFPINLESLMFGIGRSLQGVESVKRNALIIKQIMRQIIT
ncbi:Serine/threonine-protein kinase stn8, chloroplastic [Turnera subulata]|uniref:Serine/threonine-protein kinase stn8, chloroplastic n=1 Tax=Turnera subulata TaxID=218843 RepID=A0A9Q0J5H1_9ROSI|nr:Serine/threonine-protein kinase stn8, chloroplastic [Turnera subulata]